MARVVKGGVHGLYKIVVQKTGIYGNSYGVAGSSLANGSTTQSFVLDYPKESSDLSLERASIDFTGGDVWISSYQYGISALNPFDIAVQDEDSSFLAFTTGSLADVTSNAEWTEYTENELQSNFPQMSMMIIRRIQSFDGATFGQPFYRTRVIPRCWIVPAGTTGSNFQAPGTTMYRVKPAASSRKINGVPFGANLNAADNKLVSYVWTSENPLYMVSHRANGATASVAGTYRPVTSAVGTASNTKNSVVRFVESTQVATAGVADTITTSTATFTVGTSLTIAAGDMLHIVYETNYERV
jgi:hypothetical protein